MISGELDRKAQKTKRNKELREYFHVIFNIEIESTVVRIHFSYSGLDTWFPGLH